MTEYAGSPDYVGTPQSPQKTPHRSTHPTEKQTPTLSQEFYAGYLLLVQNSSMVSDVSTKYFLQI